MKTAYPLHEFVEQLRKHRDPNATADSVRAQLKRTLSAYGVEPRQAPNGRWLFPCLDVYKALGLVPSSRPEVTLQREWFTARGLDAFAAHQHAEALLSEAPLGDTPRARIDNLRADLLAAEARLSALKTRTAAVFNDEEHFTEDDWHFMRNRRKALSHLVEVTVTPLGWRGE